MLNVTRMYYSRELESIEMGLSLLKKYHQFAGGKMLSKVHISSSFSTESFQVLAPQILLSLVWNLEALELLSFINQCFEAPHFNMFCLKYTKELKKKKKKDYCYCLSLCLLFASMQIYSMYI